MKYNMNESSAVAIQRRFHMIGIAILGSLAVSSSAARAEDQLVQLGKNIFFDTSLSLNGKQSCASCHDPGVGYTGADSLVNASEAVYEGTLPERYGNRKPPTAAYCGDSPVLAYQEAGSEWIGGMFWDGRATGWTLGDPLAEQAQGPFLNPLEQAMPHARQICVRIASSAYADLFREVWGPKSLDHVKDVEGTYERVARSVAAYERSSEVNPYSSKFDLFWDNAEDAGKDVTQIKIDIGGGGTGATATSKMQNGSVTTVTVSTGGSGYMSAPRVSFMGGMGSGAAATATVQDGVVVAVVVTSGGAGYRMAPRVTITATDVNPNYWQAFRGLGLTDTELTGLAVFNDASRSNCSSCHTLTPGSAGYPMFTNYSYKNLGIPKNPDNPFYSMPQQTNPDGANWVDLGLGGFLKNAGFSAEIHQPEMGKFKVPTLRNVDLRPGEDFVKAYGHNGYFKSLPEIILFYAWRSMMDGGGCMCGGGMGGGGMGGGGMGGGGMGGGGMGCGCMNGVMFPEPEVNENRTQLTMIRMMDQASVLAFLKTLSDGYF